MSTVTAKQFIGAVKDEWQLYSNNSADYTLGLPIGFGASSIVYSALYHPPAPSSDTQRPPPTPCALKVLDLDSLPPHSLSLLRRETTLMSLSKHPNVLRVRGSWMDGHKLYIALRLMSKGSAADVMHYAWSGGMEEEVIRCILKQALEGLNYLHINGFIHRDVKAANLLIDDDGTVLLGDLGVAANLADDTDHHHLTPKRVVNFGTAAKPTRPKMGKRKSFVGTPCWMAPELIQGHQYDASADIWSFGITALELAQGRPPRSREPPQKVLLKVVQDAPPTLERDSGQHKYSRAIKEIVESCLSKDPTLRPTAAQLLATQFFKGAKKKSFLVGTVLTGLPPLTQRQERRVKSSVGSGMSARTVDSWDFMTTLRNSVSGVDGHGRRTSSNGRNSTGSGYSPRTSPTTSVFGHGRGLSMSSQNQQAAVARLERVADGETGREGVSDDDQKKFLKNAASVGDTRVSPDQTSGSSVSSCAPSSDICGESSPPSSVCGSAPKETAKFDRSGSSKPSSSAGMSSNLSAESSSTGPGKRTSQFGLPSAQSNFWRKLSTRGAGFHEKTSKALGFVEERKGVEGGTGGVVTRRMSLGKK